METRFDKFLKFPFKKYTHSLERELVWSARRLINKTIYIVKWIENNILFHVVLCLYTLVSQSPFHSHVVVLILCPAHEKYTTFSFWSVYASVCDFFESRRRLLVFLNPAYEYEWRDRSLKNEHNNPQNKPNMFEDEIQFVTELAFFFSLWRSLCVFWATWFIQTAEESWDMFEKVSSYSIEIEEQQLGFW